MIPGEIITADKPAIQINVDRKSFKMKVSNKGDRPIQVGSHYHFFETNEFLEFNRQQAYGCRLNIAAGTAVRFEPGQMREIELIPYGGLRQIFGFNKMVNGPLKGD